MRHIISVLVENEFGVLARVAGLFSGRGFNIESLCVAPTSDATVSHITLVTSGDDRVLEQITKHLNKLVNVIKVSDFSTVEHVERELVMVKVTADANTRGEVLSVVNIFRGKIVAVIGYGSQGHAHAKNLRDSGVEVCVGLRNTSPSWAKAKGAGLDVRDTAEAAAWADIVMMLVPDEMGSEIFAAEIKPGLAKGKYLAFGHGFNFHF